ncbi:MAG: hypothetical protein ACRDPY_03460 [Streptosporangiaceae bacterium]
MDAPGRPSATIIRLWILAKVPGRLRAPGARIARTRRSASSASSVLAGGSILAPPRLSAMARRAISSHLDSMLTPPPGLPPSDLRAVPGVCAGPADRDSDESSSRTSAPCPHISRNSAVKA